MTEIKIHSKPEYEFAKHIFSEAGCINGDGTSKESGLALFKEMGFAIFCAWTLHNVVDTRLLKEDTDTVSLRPREDKLVKQLQEGMTTIRRNKFCFLGVGEEASLLLIRVPERKRRLIYPPTEGYICRVPFENLFNIHHRHEHCPVRHMLMFNFLNLPEYRKDINVDEFLTKLDACWSSDDGQEPICEKHWNQIGEHFNKIVIDNEQAGCAYGGCPVLIKVPFRFVGSLFSGEEDIKDPHIEDQPIVVSSRQQLSESKTRIESLFNTFLVLYLANHAKLTEYGASLYLEHDGTKFPDEFDGVIMERKTGGVFILETTGLRDLEDRAAVHLYRKVTRIRALETWGHPIGAIYITWSNFRKSLGENLTYKMLVDGGFFEIADLSDEYQVLSQMKSKGFWDSKKLRGAYESFLSKIEKAYNTVRASLQNDVSA